MDPLTSTATQLGELLRENKLSSIDIIELYLEHISRHERTLNAFTTLAPREKLLETARTLDAERSVGRVRSRLHGIPIVLKARPQRAYKQFHQVLTELRTVS